MRNKQGLGLLGVLLAILAVSVLIAREFQRPQADAQKAENLREKPKADDEDKDEKADRDAIRKSAQEYARAFDKGDARAVGAFWTEKGTYYDESGAVIRGRAAIEKTYAELFKGNPKIKLDIEIRSIHFPSRDTAVNEGVLRLKPAGPELPTCTLFRVLHVREGGNWKVAIAREWGGNQDKLEDIAWLIGNWSATSKDREVQMNFAWNETKTLIRGRFSVKEKGVVTSSGTSTIGMEPQSGLLHSWVFDDEGGRGQALWIGDGNRWVQDTAGVLSNGAAYTAINIIAPINANEFVWQSIDRAIGDTEIPDTEPIKLRRIRADK